MFNYEKTGLLIFDNFQIDFTLPKWKARQEAFNAQNGIVGLNPFPVQPMALPRFNRRNGEWVSSSAAFVPVNGAFLTPGTVAVGGGIMGASSEIKKTSLWDRIFNRKRIKKMQDELEEARTKPNFTVELQTKEAEAVKMQIEEFFASVKNSAEELVLVKERFENYDKSIEHLKKTGQVFLIEVMEHDLEIHRAETQLYALGLRKVVTEKNLVDFAAQSPRTLKLDWIQNFARLIPQKAVEVKLNTDEKHIFDNYVVLHYDPNNKGSGETKADTYKKRDPILFGVIAGSNKLYYLADWIDEHCDLTFDKLVQTLGEKAITANDLTAEIKISN